MIIKIIINNETIKNEDLTINSNTKNEMNQVIKKKMFYLHFIL